MQAMEEYISAFSIVAGQTQIKTNVSDKGFPVKVSLRKVPMLINLLHSTSENSKG